MKILAEGYIIFYDIIMWTCMSYMQMRTNVRKYVHTMPNMHIFILTKFPVKALIQNHNILHQIEFENIIKLFCWGRGEYITLSYHFTIYLKCTKFRIIDFVILNTNMSSLGICIFQLNVLWINVSLFFIIFHMLNIYSVRHINSFDNNHLEDNSGSRKQISELLQKKMIQTKQLTPLVIWNFSLHQ